MHWPAAAGSVDATSLAAPMEAQGPPAPAPPEPPGALLSLLQSASAATERGPKARRGSQARRRRRLIVVRSELHAAVEPGERRHERYEVTHLVRGQLAEGHLL